MLLKFLYDKNCHNQNETAINNQKINIIFLA